MSLILEALKKSEARRQLGEAPGLGTPFTVPRRRRSPLPWIIVLIVVAVGIGAWYLRPWAPAVSPARQAANTVTARPLGQQAPSGAAVPGTQPPAGAPRPTPQSATPLPAGPMAAASATGSPPTGRAGPTTGRDAPAASASNNAPVAGAANVQNPRDMRSATMPAAANAPTRAPRPGPKTDAFAATRPGASGSATPASPRNAVPVAPASVDPRHAAAPAPAVKGSPTAAGANPPVQPVPAETSAPAPAANAVTPSPPAAAAPQSPGLPLYYELPYDVRKDLPTLNLSMHVYAADPGKRFVVVDGERKAEGETLKEGLTLREIRIDGLVLEFRGQRFFYPRPGR